MRRITPPLRHHTDYQIVYDWRYGERHFYEAGQPFHRAICGTTIVPEQVFSTSKGICYACTVYMRMIIYAELGL